MPDWTELQRLRTARGRPYAIELGSDADPTPVITAYADVRPIVLWGSWLGDEVILGVDPYLEFDRLNAADCWQPLSVRPRTEAPVGGLGGGWFTVLGYDPGTCWLAFCDSLLRRRSDGMWVFESLGLVGREPAAAEALDRARTAVTRTAVAGSAVARSAAVTSVSDPVPVITELTPMAGSGAMQSHLAGVERVIGRIRAGEIYQLNLCTRLAARLLETPLELFVRAAGVLRPAYGAQLPTGGTTLVSLSPERFLTVNDGTVTTSPIKGTTKRSEDPDGSVLRASAKDAAENVMITDLMRNDLSRVCTPGSVVVTGLLEVQPHPGVWHLVSTVTGQLEHGATAADLLAATFPPGSVTGAPKSSAVRAIAAEEGRPRGAYTGAAGLVTVAGRAELSVLIRTFETTGDRVELGVGGGITVDSVPALEWRECLHKVEPLARAAGSRLVAGLDDRVAPVPSELAAAGVFESILVQYGRPLRLADHLARLTRSVRELYADDLPGGLTAQVLDMAATTDGPRVAIRVQVRPGPGGLQVALSAQPLGPRLRTCRLSAAERPSWSWRHKWIDRTAMQAVEDRAVSQVVRAMSQTAREQSIPVLPYFLDPAGALAETSRGNLFVRGPDGVWRTPPAGEFLLPGVTRRALLDELADRGVPVEIAVISADELQAATAAVWTSSLSGVVAVAALDRRDLEIDATSARWARWLGLN